MDRKLEAANLDVLDLLSLKLIYGLLQLLGGPCGIHGGSLKFTFSLKVLTFIQHTCCTLKQTKTFPFAYLWLNCDKLEKKWNKIETRTKTMHFWISYIFTEGMQRLHGTHLRLKVVVKETQRYDIYQTSIYFCRYWTKTVIDKLNKILIYIKFRTDTHCCYNM